MDRYVTAEPVKVSPRVSTPVSYGYSHLSPRTTTPHQSVEGPSSSGYIKPHSSTLNGSFNQVCLEANVYAEADVFFPLGSQRQSCCVLFVCVSSPDFVSDSQILQVRKVGLGLVLRRDEMNEVFVKEVISGFAAHRQGGVEVICFCYICLLCFTQVQLSRR